MRNTHTARQKTDRTQPTGERHLINSKAFAIGLSLKEIVFFVDGTGHDNLLNGNEDRAVLGADLSGFSGGKIHRHECSEEGVV